ncbi:MAG: phosphotransferase [Lacipirellulaceae bacterium]|uniref:phosphotransferase family protein n=1 Tax=Marinobacter salarius TaxID=1420917 RepID=UPI0032EEDDD0
MEYDKNLPRQLQGLSPDWLSRVLQAKCPGIRVTAVSIEKIIPGTTTKALVHLDYEAEGAGHDIPQKLCIKGEFNEELRESFSDIETTGTQIEADFFNELAGLLSVPVPRHWYAGAEPGMGILILDNLESAGCRFGSPVEPWSPELVESGLEVLATLHAKTWDADLPALHWLHVGSPTTKQYTRHLVSDAHWDSHFREAGTFQLPEQLNDSARLMRGFETLWEHNEANAHCLVHGDAHLANTVIDQHGNPYFLDWAGVNISNWALDVAYFVTGAMTVEARRDCEKGLLDAYLVQLEKNGGPRLSHDSAWDDYRRNQLHGFLWATLPSGMQSKENVQSMGHRYCTAIIDHDTLQLLGV